VSFEDLKIRELSRLTGQWTPPIGAMGGPPAHELYRELVLYAGLQLFRDAKSNPWVVLRDGTQRHAFSVPSRELRGALDRFRMRRNLRPVPESDIDEFTRIVEARISDPDVEIPLLRSPVVERSTIPAPRLPATPDVVQREELTNQIDSFLLDLADLDRDPAEPEESLTAPEKPEGPTPEPIPVAVPAFEVETAISGARRLPPRPEANPPQFVHVLRELVHDGTWMGTTRELSELTGEDSFNLFDSLLKHRSELEESGILLTVIEVGDGYRWLAVDRAKVHNAEDALPTNERALPAQ